MLSPGGECCKEKKPLKAFSDIRKAYFCSEVLAEESRLCLPDNRYVNYYQYQILQQSLSSCKLGKNGIIVFRKFIDFHIGL
jgi:hypothetical protein